MNPSEKRQRLFKHGKPLIRPLEIYNGEGYSKDIGILWAAYKRKPFEIFGQGLSQQDFAESIEQLASKADLMVIDDENKGYKDKGPIVFLSLFSNGWKSQPQVEFFPWATIKNKLRASVTFLHWIRYSKEVGVIEIRGLKEDKPLLEKCMDYGVLFYSGKVIGGHPTGNEYIYSVKGRKR